MSTVSKHEYPYLEANPSFWGKGMKRCIVLGQGSEIARALVDRLGADWEVTGYSRDASALKPERWDLLLIASGTLVPIGRFCDLDFKAWSQGIVENAIKPLSFVHTMLPHAKFGALVVFFSGPNPKLPQPRYTSYDAAKTLLIRMTQNLAAECMGVRFVCIGPGFHKTKIHAPHDVGGRREVDTYDELFSMLRACLLAPREALGRQIHIRDPWWHELRPFPENEGA